MGTTKFLEKEDFFSFLISCEANGYDREKEKQKYLKFNIIKNCTGEEEFFTLPNGKKDGKYISRYNDGSVYQEIHYDNGKRHGKYTEMHYSGGISEECEYVNGKRHGDFLEFYHDGTINEKGKYVDGKREGIWVFSHFFSKTRQETFYRNGEIYRK